MTTTTTTDNFGRVVTQTGNSFVVSDSTGVLFSVTAPSLAQALETINSMAPDGYITSVT